jgi:8-oxo-dGTP pyrophosphatase MutT (NUDIX family)
MTNLETEDQVSAGGVAFRRGAGGPEVALICVGPRRRWQLPKGLVDPGESPEKTAVREVREETGLATELLAPIEVIEYWYVGTNGDRRVRFHKFVHFFLLAYRSGDIRDHDREVEEARWVPLDAAVSMLAFANERAVVARARSMMASSAAPD